MSALELAESAGLMRVRARDVVLADYVLTPPTPVPDSPKPYLHPLRTTAGAVVTAVRPSDHTWHNGLQFTMANLSGENFWGGRTYVRGRGYVALPNNGSVVHVGWERAECAGDRVVLCHELAWLTAAGQKWLSERRTVVIGGVDFARGCWHLSWTSELRNTSGRSLRWGSPVTEGRPTAGYGGLFWRGPRSFTGGTVRTSDGLAANAAMGHRAPWLAFTGRPDERRRGSTLLFVAGRGGHPWYVRADPFPAVSFAVTYHRPLLLEPDEGMTLTHHVAVLDGDWGPDRLDVHARDLLEEPCAS